MKIHHLNCGTMCPVAGFLVAGTEKKLVCLCLLLETNDSGLVLVDSGFGTEDLKRPVARLTSTVLLMRPEFEKSQTAVEQIKNLGFKTSDVRHIILTHLDMDHAGGISDFPEAIIHVFNDELTAALNPKNFISQHRYRSIQWEHGPHWSTYEPRGEPWFGFPAVRELKGLPPEILMIPLRGHTEGHCGVAVQTETGWQLHAGDSYFYYSEMNLVFPHCTPALNLLQRTLAVDNAMRTANQKKLRDLIASRENKVKVFCAHDTKEYKRAISGK